MGQRWRGSDLKWYQVGVVGQMRVKYFTEKSEVRKSKASEKHFRNNFILSFQFSNFPPFPDEISPLDEWWDDEVMIHGWWITDHGWWTTELVENGKRRRKKLREWGKEEWERGEGKAMNYGIKVGMQMRMYIQSTWSISKRMLSLSLSLSNLFSQSSTTLIYLCGFHLEQKAPKL